MEFIPNWAPNLHPMIVHFPIAILLLAFVFDLFSLIKRDSLWLRYTTTSVYVAGAFGAIVTFLTGRQAADSVTLPPLANPVLNEHADLALLTMLIFIIYGIVRFVFLWQNWDRKIWISVVLIITGAAGLGFLFETAEHGAELVYKYGVGVKAIETIKPEAPLKPTSESALIINENGSWQWQIDNRADRVFVEEFTWRAGKPTETKLTVVEDKQKGNALSIEVTDGEFLFTVGNPLKSLQTDMEINLDAFKGDFKLIHHFSDLDNYDFISVNANKMKLGRKENEKVKIFDEDELGTNGWFSLRAVGDGTHFRGYSNEQLVTHGHASELEAGPAGFSISGTGKILIRKIETISLQSN